MGQHASIRKQCNPPLVPHPVLKRYYGSRENRAAFVHSLFERSACSYDQIDAVASLGTGRRYRRRALLEAGLEPGMRVLDVGCGTGLVSLPAARIVGDAGYVLGVDPSAAMRDIASSHGTFDTVAGVAEDLPITGETFDMVTMGYALRHVDDLDVAFSEFLRVLSPGGTVTILEITRPRSTLGRLATRIVMNSIAPALSVVASRNADGWRLMRYFWKTIEQCVRPEQVLGALNRAGFEDTRRSVVLGVFSAYVGRKPSTAENS